MTTSSSLERSPLTPSEVSGTHRRPRGAPRQVLLVESEDDHALAWRKALAPSQVSAVPSLTEARSRFFFPRLGPDLVVIGCGIRSGDTDRDALLAFFTDTSISPETHPIYVDARRCTLETAIALLVFGATVYSGRPWPVPAADRARSTFAEGRLPYDEDELFELAKSVGATEVADRYALTGAHLELLRALLEEDHRRKVAALLGRSHGTVRVQLAQMRDRSQLTTGELVRETYAATAKCMMHLARFAR
jgi:hypothetical protein